MMALAVRSTLLFAVAVGGLAGCDRKQEPAPASFSSAAPLLGGFNRPRGGQAFALGERAEVPELAITVEATKRCRSEHLKQGNLMFGVELSVVGRAQTVVHFNPFHCKVQDAARASYTPTFKGCEPRLRDHRLRSGDRVRGWVSFELPEHAKELELVCTQATAGQENRVLKFALGGH